MTQAKHTPGPWISEQMKTKPGACPVIFGVDRYAVCMKHSDDTIKRWSANARLIAAAPDLLAACQRVEKALMKGRYPELQGVACDVSAAISKALGTA